MAVKNLGKIVALIKSNTEPSNQDVIWRDTSTSPESMKFYDTVAGVWKDLIIDATTVLDLIEFKLTTFNSSLDLNRNRLIIHTVNSSINFTKSSEDAVNGSKLYIILTADGTNAPTFDSAFTIVYNNYQNTNGTENLITIQVVKDDKFLVDIRPIS